MVPAGSMAVDPGNANSMYFEVYYIGLRRIS